MHIHFHILLHTTLDHFLIHTSYRKQYLLIKHGRITIECNTPEEFHKTLGKYIRYQRKKETKRKITCKTLDRKETKRTYTDNILNQVSYDIIMWKKTSDRTV